MSVGALDRRFESFQEYIDSQTRSRLTGPDGTPLYAHHMDEWILRAMNSLPVKNMLDRSLDTIISVQLGQYLAEGIHIDQKTFPDLFERLSHCSKTLGIPIPHAVAHDEPGSNFNAWTAGTDEYSFINITSGLLSFFTVDEAGFVIGHECGHMHSKHMVYHTLAWVLLTMGARMLGPLGFLIFRTAGMPLLAWERRSEVTCDRAGLLCCGSIQVAERALIR